MEFSCTARHAEGRVIITVAGDVDLAAHERFQAEVEQWLPASGGMVIDCSGVTFLDSMGLRVLVQARQRAADEEYEFALAAPSQPVLRVLELAGVKSLFPIVASSTGSGPGPDMVS
jgi:anti-anti-sigma factor